MLFLPVTRAWSIEPVMAALNVSDIPRSVVLLIDSPGCEGWFAAFADSGWAVRFVCTHNPYPPEGRVQRRRRHLAMRRLSQKMTANLDRVLYLEDDTLVPPDVWSRLSVGLDAGYVAASGVQLSRHEPRIPGIWRFNDGAGIYDPFEPVGVETADAVGHFCLMTTGEAYANAPIKPNEYEPIDQCHTQQFAPIWVDPEVRCGHLKENGEIIV